MEKLSYEFRHGTPVPKANRAVLVGVLGSGNLEVLVESAALGGTCRMEVETAAVGFGQIWEAVLTDIFDQWRVGDVRISINDAGATPAVVSLRLNQALQAFAGPTP